MAVVIDFTKTQDAIILDLINGSQTPATQLTLADITLSIPAVNTTDPETTGDTSIAVSGVAESGYDGTATVTYNRVDIEVVAIAASTTEFEVGSAVNVVDLLPAINAAFGINLTSEMVTDAVLPSTDEGAAQFNLTMSATNKVYSGVVELTLSPNLIDINSVIETKALDGLDFA